MKDQWEVGVASGFGLFDGFYDAGDLHGFGERPGDDLAGVKVHDAGEVNESVRRPDVGDVRAPDGIGTLGIELFIKDVVKLFAEIGITGGGDPGLDPLGFDPHLTHILADGAFRDDFTALAKLDCDLRRAVVLFELVVDLPDPFFEMFFPAFCFGRLVTEKRAETGFVSEINIEFGDARFILYKRIRKYIDDTESAIPLDVANNVFHRHSFYEFHFAVKGSLTLCFRDRRYILPEGMFIGIPPEVPHYTEISGRIPERDNICLNLEKTAGESGFYDAYARHIDNLCDVAHVTTASLQAAITNFCNIKHPYTMREYCRQKLIGYELVYRLFPGPDVAADTDTSGGIPYTSYDLDEMVYDIRIPLTRIAVNLGYSVRHTDRIIKKIYGETLSNIRGRQMLESAKNVLDGNPSCSLDELLAQTGFSCPSSLYNAFERYEHCSLTEYRNRLMCLNNPLTRSKEK